VAQGAPPRGKASRQATPAKAAPRGEGREGAGSQRAREGSKTAQVIATLQHSPRTLPPLDQADIV